MLMPTPVNARGKSEKVRCPYCGYEMPIFVRPGAICRGITVKCKGKHCRKEFEIKVNVK